MDLAFENISSLLIFTIVFLIFYTALLNIYFIYKNGFHVRVNCWFCNKNSKVLYSSRNNFECPFCFQYNGFNKDGGYNKVIEAQHKTSLNTQKIIYSKQKTGHLTPKSSNGLCDSCNRNQELKIIQLANYEALEERNYDKEVVHFEKQLEKTYGLCKTCSKFLQNNLRKQSAWIFGTRIKNLNKLKSFKSRNTSQGSQGANRFYHRLRITRIILFALSFFNLSVLCGLHVFLPKNLLPQSILPSNVILSDLYSSVYNFSVTNFGPKSFMIYLPKTINIHESSLLQITILGLFLELLFTFVEGSVSLFVKFNKMFSWLVLGIVSLVPFQQDVYLYFRTLEIFCSLYLTYVYSSTFIESASKPPEKFHLKRIKRDKNKYSDNDESDSDSLNNSKTSYRTAVNRHSPITASSFDAFNKSFEPIRSTTSTRYNSLINNGLPTVKNVELNKYFNELNIGVFGSNMSRDGQRPVSPNPFLNQSTRPQSPTSLYNYGSAYNRPSSPFINQSQYRSVFAPQSPGLNCSLNNIAKSPYTFNEGSQGLHQQTSAMSINAEPTAHDQSYNIIGKSYNNQGILNEPSTSFLLKNNYHHSNSFSPRDTSSVISQNISAPRSPGYNLRSSHRNISSPISDNRETLLNSSFQPSSPHVTLERPATSPLSPPKLHHLTSFHSSGKGTGSLRFSLHTGGIPNSSIWPNLNQRFVVNSLSNIIPSSPLNGSFVRENINVNTSNSRSSSTSSGFISSGDGIKGLSKSLPNSRDNSPERSSLLSQELAARV